MHFKIAGVVGFFLAVSTVTLAQKNEVSISVGAVATSDQQTQFLGITCPVNFPTCAGPFHFSTSTGVAFEGDYTRQIFNFHVASVGAEFPLLGVPSRDVNTSAIGFPSSKFSLSSLFFTPSARIKFLPSGAISPFFSLGGGLAHYEAASSVNRGALQFGGGADFKTPLPHFAIRLEVRDFWAKGLNDSSSGNPSVKPERLHNVFGGGGVVFKF